MTILENGSRMLPRYAADKSRYISRVIYFGWLIGLLPIGQSRLFLEACDSTRGIET